MLPGWAEKVTRLPGPALWPPYYEEACGTQDIRVLPRPPGAGVQPRQDPGDTLRMNGIKREREKTHETSLDRAKSARERGRERERERESDQTGGAESGNALFFTIAFIP